MPHFLKFSLFPISPFFFIIIPNLSLLFPSTLLFFTRFSPVTFISLSISLCCICCSQLNSSVPSTHLPRSPPSSWHLAQSFQFDLSFLSTFLISSPFLSEFYTSLHLNPSSWSILLHPPLFLSGLCWYTDCQSGCCFFFAASWRRNSCWQNFFSLYSKWKSLTGNTWHHPFLLDSN